MDDGSPSAGKSAAPVPRFLQGGGEAGALIRSIDWSKSVLGPPAAWPSPLKTTLATMLHSRHPMFLWWGPELIQFYNDAYTPSFGRGKHPAAMGQRGEECWPEIWSIIFPQIRNVMERAEPSWHENQLVPIFRNGRIEDVYWTYGYSPIFDEEHRVVGTLVVCLETTGQVYEHKAVDDARRAADAARTRLSNLLAGAPAFVCTLAGPNHTFELVNPLYQQLIGRDRDAIGKPIVEALPEIEEQGFVQILDHVFTTGESYTGYETRVRLQRSSDEQVGEHFVTFVYQPRRDEQGRVDGIDVFGFDVTEAVAARIEAQRARDASRALEESIPQQVWTATATGELEHVNGRVVEYLGTDTERILASGWTAFVHPEDQDASVQQWRHSVASGDDYEVEFRLRGNDGTYRWHLARALAIRRVDGSIERWFGTNTDIDEQKQLRDRLRAQTEFEKHLLGIVSHDLRTPLSAIALGSSVLAEQSNMSPRSAGVILRIQSSTRRAIRMIDDLMDFTQARLGGGLPVNPRRVNLREIVDAVYEELMFTHPSRAIKVAYDGDLEGSWDPDRVAQLLANLVTNAVSYGNPDEPIHISIRGESEHVVIAVHNTGSPIPAAARPRLFEPLQRGTKSSGERSIGLGLYIVREIARSHRGSVEVQSDEAAGTTFSVRLPRTCSSS